MAQLHDVLAEVGFDRPRCRLRISDGLSSISSVVIDLPLTTRLRHALFATFEDVVARLRGIGGEEHLASVGFELRLQRDQQLVEMARWPLP